MPNYNNGLFLAKSIQSILNQSFKDFEFIIVDDASTDESVKVIKSFKDPRIKLVERSINGGIVPALNDAITASSGEYLIRMDADDISIENRIELLSAHLDANPNVGVVSSWLETFGDQNEVWKYPTDNASLKARLLFGTPLAHAASAIRKSILDSSGIFYSDKHDHLEDYQLFFELSKNCEFGVIPKVLYRYRYHGNNITTKNMDSYKKRFISLNREVAEYFLGSKISSIELNANFCLSRGVLNGKKDLNIVLKWRKKLVQEFKKNFPEMHDALVSELDKNLRTLLFKYIDKFPIKGFFLSLKEDFSSLGHIKYAMNRMICK